MPVYRIADKEYESAEAWLEVARLRTLPLEEVLALKKAGRVDEWEIATKAKDPELVPERSSPTARPVVKLDKADRLIQAMESVNDTLTRMLDPTDPLGAEIEETPSGSSSRPAPAPGPFVHAQYRIEDKLYAPEEAEREVARLRALPDIEIGALQKAGRLEAWNIACGADVPKPASVPREGEWRAERAPVEKTSSVPTSAAGRATAGSPPRKREPELTSERRAALEAELDAAFDAGDIDAFVALQQSKDYASYLLDKASERAHERGTSLLLEGDHQLALALIDREAVRRKAFDKLLEKRVAQIEERLGTLTSAATDALERRVGELEQRESGLRYCGTWKESGTYRRGDFVTHAGSLWHSWEPTPDRPGTTSAWQLAVKAGKDGRDAR